MDNARFILSPIIGMSIIFASARERIIPLSQQLQHELIRLEPQSEQHALVTIIRTHPITGLKMEGSSQLNSLVPPGSGMDIFADRTVIFIGGRHLADDAHKTIGAQQYINSYH